MLAYCSMQSYRAHAQDRLQEALCSSLLQSITLLSAAKGLPIKTWLQQQLSFQSCFISSLYAQPLPWIAYISALHMHCSNMCVAGHLAGTSRGIQTRLGLQRSKITEQATCAAGRKRSMSATWRPQVVCRQFCNDWQWITSGSSNLC